MQYVGFGVVVVALIALVVGLLERRKGKRVLSTPFRRTGEIGNTNGEVSCEGAVWAAQPAIAPCSGQPCLYYEIEVVQHWSKQTMTEDGVKTETGTTTIQSVKSGAVFLLDDGTGPVRVDAREGMDVELERSFEQEQSIAQGMACFGQFHTHVPHAGDGKQGRCVRVIEKIVPIQGGLFVMGQVANGCIGKPNGVFGSLLASRKGRAALLGTTKRNATIGFVAFACLLCPGVGLAAFAPAPALAADGESTCTILDQSKPGSPCTGKIHDDDGSTAVLTVTEAGTFSITAGPPLGKKIPVVATITVKDETGHALVTDELMSASAALEVGKYTITVKDSVPGDAQHLRGGFSYELSVARTARAPAPAAFAQLAPVARPAPQPAAPAKAKGKARGRKPSAKK
jgi:hypothetical protein